MAKVTKEQPKKGIPGAVFVDDGKKDQKLNTKNKEKSATASGLNEINKKMAEIKIATAISGEQIEEEQKNKQIRKLKKSLREIELIEEKIKNGQQVELTQIEKAKKKESIIDELKQLGADDL